MERQREQQSGWEFPGASASDLWLLIPALQVSAPYPSWQSRERASNGAGELNEILLYMY